MTDKQCANYECENTVETPDDVICKECIDERKISLPIKMSAVDYIRLFIEMDMMDEEHK